MPHRLEIYEPPAAAIDWQAFGDCVISTRWGSPRELWDELGGGKSTAWNAWNGKPVGLVPFLRICKLAGLRPLDFLMVR